MSKNNEDNKIFGRDLHSEWRVVIVYRFNRSRLPNWEWGVFA